MTRRLHPLISHQPDPEHPGWWTWDVAENPPGAHRYNATIGKLIVRGEGDGRARVRMFPTALQSNLGNVMHGGAILTFIDMAMFAGGHAAGADIAFSVTLDLSAQFLSPGELEIPVDATVEVLKETRRLVFMRGLVVQEKETVAAWSGTLRKNMPQQ
jgi:uncharacterized protein (TIGR00369 family)